MFINILSVRLVQLLWQFVSTHVHDAEAAQTTEVKHGDVSEQKAVRWFRHNDCK